MDAAWWAHFSDRGVGLGYVSHHGGSAEGSFPDGQVRRRAQGQRPGRHGVHAGRRQRGQILSGCPERQGVRR